MNLGIYESCNAYFGNVYLKIMDKYDSRVDAMNNWSKHVKSFGLGNYLGYDMPAGQKGLIPDSKLYNRYYPNHKWKAITTISNAIGQGEVLTTPIQLANMTAAIANRGYFFTPHIRKKVGDSVNQDEKYTTRRYTTIEPRHFEPVIEGLFNVFEKPNGTAHWSKVKGIEICGKTGTSENPHGQDHSIFIAFAPKNNPKIAIAVFVENGYWGSRWAGPIASLMIEKYLTGTVTNTKQETFILNGNLMNPAHEN